MASSRANFTFCTIMPGQGTRCRDSLRAGLPHDRTPMGRNFPSQPGDHDAHPAPSQMETRAFLGVKRPGSDNRSSERVAILSPLTLYACIVMYLGDTHTLYRSVISTVFYLHWFLSPLFFISTVFYLHCFLSPLVLSPLFLSPLVFPSLLPKHGLRVINLIF